VIEEESQIDYPNNVPYPEEVKDEMQNKELEEVFKDLSYLITCLADRTTENPYFGSYMATAPKYGKQVWTFAQEIVKVIDKKIEKETHGKRSSEITKIIDDHKTLKREVDYLKGHKSRGFVEIDKSGNEEIINNKLALLEEKEKGIKLQDDLNK
jgi:hypothetical protein